MGEVKLVQSFCLPRFYIFLLEMVEKSKMASLILLSIIDDLKPIFYMH